MAIPPSILLGLRCTNSLKRNRLWKMVSCRKLTTAGRAGVIDSPFTTMDKKGTCLWDGYSFVPPNGKDYINEG